jgi:CxxH/CxxC protein (TIGR04129 family)
LYVVCKEHVELAIDHFVDEYEDAPDIVSLVETTFSAWVTPDHCHFCGDRPYFLVV